MSEATPVEPRKTQETSEAVPPKPPRTPEEEAAHLLKKAGLPPDTRLTRCKVSRYRVFKWKE